MYNKKHNKMVADCLEEYIDIVEKYCILEGKKKADVKKAEKIIMKAVKDLRNNKPENVYDEERFYKVMNETEEADEDW